MRTPDVDRAAAAVASITPVRAALLDFQRSFGHANVSEDMEARDAADSSRAAAPLRPADGAFVLDTTALDADAAFAAALRYVASTGLTRS